MLRRLEEKQDAILVRLDKLQGEKAESKAEKSDDEWIQEGISSIMGFKVGGKKDGKT